jgi:ankyrin repeat protein
MTTLYQNLLNFQSNSGLAKAVDARGRRSSISLPVTACAQYIGRLTQKKKPKRSVKFPSSVIMQQAIIDGDVQEVKQILEERGSCVANEREPGGLYPAMRCVFESQLEALKVLVDAGADLTAQDGENWTVLHVAASMDDLEAAKFVLNQCKQCLTHVRNVDGERAIDLAESTDMARLLLEADLRSHETTSDGENAILVLVRDHHAKNGDCQALDAAMQSGTSYDSLLHLAAGKNYPLLASYLLRHRLCRLEARGKRGRTALHTAAYFNNIDMVLLLVQSGASTQSLTNSYEKASDLTTHELVHFVLQEEYL